MRRTRTSKSIAAWIAALGILVAALAPSLSHALRGGAGASWVEVCSAFGLKIVNVDASPGAPRPSNDGGHLLEHCPYCSLHADSAPLPPSSMTTVTLLVLSFEKPRLFFSAPRSLFAWTAPQSRAPPLSA